MALAFAFTGIASAATDIVGTKYASAMTRLNALGILKGYTDGTFRPATGITRAEFAVVVVRALGLEEAAKGTLGGTKFIDVPATHWASGYVNVAVGRGVIRGYPDGTFRPEASVSNVEAIAMIVRILGYEPSIVGEWPMNYVSKASEIGLTSGLTIATGLSASRGDVALMIDKALTIPLMVQSTYGSLQSYVISTQTLLANKLAVTEIEARVTGTPLYARGDLKANELYLRRTANCMPSRRIPWRTISSAARPRRRR
jgi:hypothetical protein